MGSLKHQHPPPDWPQKLRTGLPFPPGRDGEVFDIFRDKGRPGEWDTYHINNATLEVYHQTPDGWDQPGWLQLPARVRAYLWSLHNA